MSNPNHLEPNSPNVDTVTTPTTPTAPPLISGDVENQTPAGPPTEDAGKLNMNNIIRRWKREETLKKVAIILRGCALCFSLLAFIIMATNSHGDWRDFSNYQEYRYVLAIAILSTLYTGFQVFKHLKELSTGVEFMIPKRRSIMLDFAGDQVMAYLLLSALSSAIPLTNRMREGADNIFTDASATTISFEFFAFLALGISALISGFKLSNQTYM